MTTVQSDVLSERVVVVGAGHAGVSLATQLRRSGHHGSLLLFGDELHDPYHRPPLSKAFGGGRLEQQLLTASSARALGIDIRNGVRVTAIDRVARTVTFADGEVETYDKLILAPGALPRRLSLPGDSLPGVLTVRTLDDGIALREAIIEGARIVIIGGGWIGLEVAAGARLAGANVTIVERESRLLARAGSLELARHLTEWHESQGIRVQTNMGVSAIVAGEGGRAVAVQLASGEQLPCELVVVGIGAQPDVALAFDAGLECNGGIIVDESGRTSDPAIFAIGDAARPPVGPRLESIPSATEQAAAVVSALLKTDRHVPPTPWFWSDQGPLKIQIAGLISDGTRAVRHLGNNNSCVVLHVDDDGVLRAVESIGAARAFATARRMISEMQSVDPTAPPVDLLPEPPRSEVIFTDDVAEVLQNSTVIEPDVASTPAVDGGLTEALPSHPDGHVRIRFVHSDGSIETVAAEEGTSVMECAVEAGVPWIVGECGGGCSCGTCCVDVAPPWAELLEDPMPEEEDVVEFADGAGPCTRLSCQLLLTPAIDGLVVRCPRANA